MNIPFEKIDEEHVEKVLNSHLDKDSGSEFWLEEAERSGGIDDIKEYVDSKEKLIETLGLQDEERRERFVNRLKYGSYEEMIPESAKDDIYILGESGATTGAPKRAAFTNKDWQKMLDVTNEFLDELDFPEGEDWVQAVPPAPPHGIGRYPETLCRSRGGNIYGIDLDPRIMKKFGREGMKEAVGRYKKHLGEQLMPILKSQDPKAIFTTADFLEMLPKFADPEDLDFDGIFHGGSNLTEETYKLFREELYEGAPIVGIIGSGYSGGHGLQIPTEDYSVAYVPVQPFNDLDVVDEDGRPVDYGEEGRVVISKYTEDFLMPNFEEDLTARKVKLPEDFESDNLYAVEGIEPDERRKELDEDGVY